MPWLRLNQFDANGGSSADLPAQSVPPNIFTNAKNVSFRDGAVEKASGMAEQYGTPPIAPYFLLSSQTTSGEKRLFLAGLTAIYSYLSANFTDVSRAVGGVYAASANNVWTGGVLHGIPFLNNNTDVPQEWDAATVKFKNMVTWPAGYTAQSLRAFKNFLIALNYTSGTTPYPHNVMWSHPADPGTMPNSWDAADATKDAGNAPLSDTPGHILDGLAMGDNFVIYKEDATILMQFIGAPNIFKFRTVLRESGILAKNCVGEVLGRHVVLTPDDAIMFNGSQAESIMNRRWRRNLFSQISVADFAKSFVTVFPNQREVWFCISTQTGFPPDLAYVWNWKENTWAKRDIPFAQSIISAFTPDPTDASWDSDAGTWDSDGESWSAFILRGKVGVVASPTYTKIYTMPIGEKIGTANMSTVLEHESYDFANTEDASIADAVKHISKLRPKIIGDTGIVLTFEIGVQMHLNDPIDWGTSQTFTLGTTKELCVSRNGRYISWRIMGTGSNSWRLEALDILVQMGGRY